MNKYIMKKIINPENEISDSPFIHNGKSQIYNSQKFKNKLIMENPSEKLPFIEYDLDISCAVSAMKNRYNELRLFKYVFNFDCCIRNSKLLKPFTDYLTAHSEKSKDVVLNSNWFFKEEKERRSTENEFYSFTILDDNFGLVFRKQYIGSDSLVLLFFNDINIMKNKFFNKTSGKLDPGVYEMLYNDRRGHYITEISVKKPETPILNENLLEILDYDIDSFINSKDFYIKNNLLYKLGIMIYGSPGNGKTTLVKYFISRYTQYHNLLLTVSNFNDEIVELIDYSFPKDMIKILVFEDIDCLPQYQRSSFLNFIDGVKILENCVILATTNYPEQVDPALINRPSRFDKIYRIDEPKDEARKQFLLKYFPKFNDKELIELSEKTKLFSGAYYLELFKMVKNQKIEIDQAIDRLNNQIKICKSYNFKDGKPVGFVDY